ncbi:TetR/AcrR family transcriptional regulator [Microbacterium pygmaeum]|uniref:DNA-binding transcriptional regulator, AcrR family n=1 Tax=Microbacterium pygmaeum TaxID=370764 RepID=A0A1G7Y429_9MICO|nr:TetR/AcrR family transcriptional regulator [Microbacterium pygmaeum]SDG91174.1 DNA-binding transcriptional regulator, AcrR family [Microbacterium pygmaeum]
MLLKERLVVAATRIVDRNEQLSLRAIAKECGVTAPAIYTHFENLSVIEQEVMHAGFAELARDVQTGILSEKDPVDALLAGCRAYVNYGWEHRNRYRLMFSAGSFALNAMDTFLAAERAIERCVDAGRSASTDTRSDTYLLWLGLHGVATLEKPTRLEYLGLPSSDATSYLTELARRMAQIA